MRCSLVVVAALAACGRISFDEHEDASAVAGDVSADGAPAANVMFVTSQPVTPGALGGLAGADMACSDAARNGGLPPNTYVAWLSTSTASAASRLGTARGWVRPDGLPFADQVSDIVAGRILYPPRIDERGQPSASGVVTATKLDGTLDSNGSCQDYASTTGSVRVGVAANGTDTWTDATTLGCGMALKLYCFGIDHQTPVTVPPSTAKRAFLSRVVTLGGGRAALDQQCRDDGMGTGIGTNFAAFVATTTASASSGFTPQPYRRLDDVIVTTDLVSLTAPITLRADGGYASANIWSGAVDPTQLGTTETCIDWMSNSIAQSGRIGDSASTTTAWFGANMNNCSSTLSVYCFEQ